MSLAARAFCVGALRTARACTHQFYFLCARCLTDRRRRVPAAPSTERRREARHRAHVQHVARAREIAGMIPRNTALLPQSSLRSAVARPFQPRLFAPPPMSCLISPAPRSCECRRCRNGARARLAHRARKLRRAWQRRMGHCSTRVPPSIEIPPGPGTLSRPGLFF